MPSKRQSAHSSGPIDFLSSQKNTFLGSDAWPPVGEQNENIVHTDHAITIDVTFTPRGALGCATVTFTPLAMH